MLNKNQLDIFGNWHGIVLFIQKSIIGKDSRPLLVSNQLQIPMLKKRIDYVLVLKEMKVHTGSNFTNSRYLAISQLH